MSVDRALPSLIVLAKSPTAGRVKTRCSPPCSPAQAAQLAQASLEETLRTVLDVPAAGRVLVLDGEPGTWLPTGFRVIRQRTGSLGERIDAAFADVGGPAILIGMDTPQIETGLLANAVMRLAAEPEVALVGPAGDGGFWMVGLRHAPSGLFAQVPMSRDDTCRSLIEALTHAGIGWVALPFLNDFDDFEAACSIARTIPDSGFAATVGRINADLGRAPLRTMEPEESR